LPTWPNPPTLDTFTRANENPLSDGGNFGAWGVLNQEQLLSNKAADSASGVNISQWTRDTFAASQYVFGVIATWNLTGGDGGQFYLLGCSDNIGSAAYRIELQVTSPAGAPANLALRRLGAHAWFHPCTLTGLPANVAAGDSLGLGVNGSTIEAWYAIGGTWALIDTADDFTLSGGNPPIGPGRAAIGANIAHTPPDGPQWSAFGAGPPGTSTGILPLTGAG